MRRLEVSSPAITGWQMGGADGGNGRHRCTAVCRSTSGLTASAGISYNKLLAKLASSQRKPNGQFVITPAMGPDFIASCR